MIINNKEISTRIRLGFMMFTLVCLALIVFSLIYSWSSNHMFEIAMAVFLLLAMVFFFLKKYCYIFYNNEGSKIILRYMTLQPLSHGNYSIEIAKNNFVKYEVKPAVFGLRQQLILYVRTPQGVARFKPVSLSSLTQKEKNDLIESLNSML